MTENKAIEELHRIRPYGGIIPQRRAEALDVAIKALEEVQQYRQIGTVEECREAVEKQPIAYDPDRVMHQLEERTAFLKDCTKYGNKTAEQQSKSYDTMMMYEVKDLVDDLLEIVKAGGAECGL